MHGDVLQEQRRQIDAWLNEPPAKQTWAWEDYKLQPPDLPPEPPPEPAPDDHHLNWVYHMTSSKFNPPRKRLPTTTGTLRHQGYTAEITVFFDPGALGYQGNFVDAGYLANLEAKSGHAYPRRDQGYFRAAWGTPQSTTKIDVNIQLGQKEYTIPIQVAQDFNYKDGFLLGYDWLVDNARWWSLQTHQQSVIMRDGSHLPLGNDTAAEDLVCLLQQGTPDHDDEIMILNRQPPDHVKEGSNDLHIKGLKSKHLTAKQTAKFEKIVQKYGQKGLFDEVIFEDLNHNLIKVDIQPHFTFTAFN